MYIFTHATFWSWQNEMAFSLLGPLKALMFVLVSLLTVLSFLSRLDDEIIIFCGPRQAENTYVASGCSVMPSWLFLKKLKKWWITLQILFTSTVTPYNNGPTIHFIYHLSFIFMTSLMGKNDINRNLPEQKRIIFPLTSVIAGFC